VISAEVRGSEVVAGVDGAGVVTAAGVEVVGFRSTPNLAAIPERFGSGCPVRK
jgi:hypothetical protein